MPQSAARTTKARLPPGVQPVADSAVGQRFGIVLQESGIEPYLSVREAVDLYRGYYPHPLPADHVQAWRLTAWVFSLAAYTAHIWYEHFRLRNAPRSTALHAAVAVAIGAIGLALAGMIHSLSTGAALRPAWLLALVLWPAITAVPAFLVAFAVAAVLGRRHSI